MSRKTWKLKGSSLEALRAELAGNQYVRLSFTDDIGALKIEVTTPAANERPERIWLTHAGRDQPDR